MATWTVPCPSPRWKPIDKKSRPAGREGKESLSLTTIENYLNNIHPILERAENIQHIYNSPALKALQHGMNIPSYSPLAMQNAALTAHLAPVYATAAEAFHPAISAVAMCQQPYMSIAETMAEYQRTLDYINRVPALIKMQNTFLQLERFMPTVIMSSALSNMSAILPALEYLHTEHPDSYQQIDSILSVEMDEDGSIEQYIQEMLSKLKDTIPVTNSNLPQYLFILEQSLDLISPFVDEPLKTSIEQLRSLIIILAYVIFENIPKCK